MEIQAEKHKLYEIDQKTTERQNYQKMETDKNEEIRTIVEEKKNMEVNHEKLKQKLKDC